MGTNQVHAVLVGHWLHPFLFRIVLVCCRQAARGAQRRGGNESKTTALPIDVADCWGRTPLHWVSLPKTDLWKLSRQPDPGSVCRTSQRFP